MPHKQFSQQSLLAKAEIRKDQLDDLELDRSITLKILGEIVWAFL